MLRYSFDMGDAADAVRAAVTAVLDAGLRTRDIADASTPRSACWVTAAMGDAVVARL